MLYITFFTRAAGSASSQELNIARSVAAFAAEIERPARAWRNGGLQLCRWSRRYRGKVVIRAVHIASTAGSTACHEPTSLAAGLSPATESGSISFRILPLPLSRMALAACVVQGRQEFFIVVLVSPAKTRKDLRRVPLRRFGRMFVAFRMTPEIAQLRSTHLSDKPALPPDTTELLRSDIETESTASSQP